MGGRHSRSSTSHNKHLHAGGRVNLYAAGRQVHKPSDFKLDCPNEVKENMQSDSLSEVGWESPKKQSQQLMQSRGPTSFHDMGTTGYESNEDDFYDGIPRFPRALSLKSRSIRSKQAVAKVTLGLGKAVEVLDTLGSSMTSLNKSGGFGLALTTKGSELQILAFEVANTIMKGSTLVQFLSKWNIRQLKEVILPSEGVQRLVSEDINELLTIVAKDKREELKIFSGEVVRFGNNCKDSQWHNLDRYFDKRRKEVTSSRQLQEAAEQMMQQLMTLVQCTAELYHEMHALDRLEQDYQFKCLERNNPYAAQRGNNISSLRTELKSQRKLVKNLKKKSLWSRSLEEVMEKLVDVVLFLNWEICNAFSMADSEAPLEGSQSNQQKLGPAGLALHYANIVIQIDTLVARCNSMPTGLRDTLYQSLPPSIKSSLRSRLRSFHAKEGLTVTEIKDEMEKTLHWLVPIAINTAKAHHGFGWVGEWANTGSEVNRRSTAPMEILQIETFHHADKDRTEAHILELVLWLNHLLRRVKVDKQNGEAKSATKSPIQKTLQEKSPSPMQLAISDPSLELSLVDQNMLQNVISMKRSRGISKSQDFDSMQDRSSKHDRLSRSTGNSPTSGTKEPFPVSSNAMIQFGFDREKTLDAIDGVDTRRR